MGIVETSVQDETKNPAQEDNQEHHQKEEEVVFLNNTCFWIIC